MPNSARSSAGCSTCRIEWRPSRWLVAALLILSLLAVIAVLASEMPRPLAWPLALLVAGSGPWLARRELRQPVREFVFAGDRAQVLLDGERIEAVEVFWRGPLAFVRWCDGGGKVRCLAWWPDTLPARLRRELRLAAPVAGAARGRASVAP